MLVDWLKHASSNSGKLKAPKSCGQDSAVYTYFTKFYKQQHTLCLDAGSVRNLMIVQLWRNFFSA